MARRMRVVRSTLTAAVVVCAALVAVGPAHGWSPQQVGANQAAFAEFDPYQLSIVQRGRDFLRYDSKGNFHGVALSELSYAYADLYVASRKRNRATAKLVKDIFDPVSAFPLCTGVRLTKWLKRLVDAYNNAETTIDELQLVDLDQRIEQDLRYIDYLHYWIDRYDLRSGRFTHRQNPNNRARAAVRAHFVNLRREVEEAQKAAASACRPVSVSVRLIERLGRGTVTATGPGVPAGGGAGPFKLRAGTTITLTATPDPGYVFVGWHAARCGRSEVSGAHKGKVNPWTCTVTPVNPDLFVITADAVFCQPEQVSRCEQAI